MLDTLNLILNVNFVTAMVVVMLAVGSGIIFREVTNANLMTAVLVPLLAFGGLVSIYALGQAGIFFTSQKETNAVVSSSVGIILALLVMLGFIRSRFAINEMRRPPDAAGRLQDTE